jgi:hypothetical protein
VPTPVGAVEVVQIDCIAVGDGVVKLAVLIDIVRF